MTSLYIQAFFYMIAGIYHFVNPRFYMKIMPTYLPYHLQFIYISGVMEFIFGAMLIPEATRSTGAWLLIVLLIGVFPANIQMAVNFYQRKKKFYWATLVRLPLQLALIWWAYQFTGN